MGLPPNENAFFLHAMQFGHIQDGEELSRPLEHFGRQLYRTAWDAYVEAGCPFGESDEALLVWYTFGSELGYDEPHAGVN